MENNNVEKPIVDLAKYGFVIEPRYFFYGWSKSPAIFAERTLAAALAKARKKLPKGYNFKIWDCQRSYKVQIAMLASFKKRIALQYPKATPKEKLLLLHRFGAKPLRRVLRPDTHRNGGAVDLTIVDKKGHTLYMGTDHDDLTARAATQYFALLNKRTTLDREALKNRKLLINALSHAGLRNYHREWWHWYVPTKEELGNGKNKTKS